MSDAGCDPQAAVKARQQARPTRVVNLRDKSAQEFAERGGEVIYIGRGSKWGNPFTFWQPQARHDGGRSREEAVRMYEEWLKGQTTLLADLHELRGKVLGCYCKPEACHGDVLARLADNV